VKLIMKAFNCSNSILFFIFLLLFIPSFCFSQGIDGIMGFVNSPQTMVDWFAKEFSYQWQMYPDCKTPSEMVSAKKGDCDDFAFLASALLRRMKIPNEILILKFKGLKMAHAVCAFKKEDGAYSFISNKKLFHTGKYNRSDAIKKFYPDCEEIIVKNPSQ